MFFFSEVENGRDRTCHRGFDFEVGVCLAGTGDSLGCRGRTLWYHVFPLLLPILGKAIRDESVFLAFGRWCVLDRAFTGVEALNSAGGQPTHCLYGIPAQVPPWLYANPTHRWQQSNPVLVSGLLCPRWPSWRLWSTTAGHSQVAVPAGATRPVRSRVGSRKCERRHGVATFRRPRRGEAKVRVGRCSELFVAVFEIRSWWSSLGGVSVKSLLVIGGEGSPSERSPLLLFSFVITWQPPLSKSIVPVSGLADDGAHHAPCSLRSWRDRVALLSRYSSPSMCRLSSIVHRPSSIVRRPLSIVHIVHGPCKASFSLSVSALAHCHIVHLASGSYHHVVQLLFSVRIRSGRPR